MYNMLSEQGIDTFINIYDHTSPVIRELEKKNFILPEKESLFKGNQKIKDKYNSYLREFKFIYPNQDILSKNYEVTLIRDLIMFFLYQEKKQNSLKTFNLTVISKLFNHNSHTGVKYAIDKVKGYIDNPKTLTTSNKTKFFYLFYKYNRILGDYNLEKKEL